MQIFTKPKNNIYSFLILAFEDSSLGEYPNFIYDETGMITGYTTKTGGADSVFPFKSEMTTGEAFLFALKGIGVYGEFYTKDKYLDFSNISTITFKHTNSSGGASSGKIIFTKDSTSVTVLPTGTTQVTFDLVANGMDTTDVKVQYYWTNIYTVVDYTLK